MLFVQQALGKVGGSFTLAEHLSLLNLTSSQIAEWGNINRSEIPVLPGEEDYVYAWSPSGMRISFSYIRRISGIAVLITEPHFLTYWSKTKRKFAVSDLNVEIPAINLFPIPGSLSPVAVASALSNQDVSTVAITNISQSVMKNEIRVQVTTAGMDLVAGEFREAITEDQLMAVCATDAWLRVATERTWEPSQKVCRLNFDPFMVTPLSCARGSGLLAKKPAIARVSPSVVLSGLGSAMLSRASFLILFEMVADGTKRYYAFSKIDSFCLICSTSLDLVRAWVENKEKEKDVDEIEDDDWGILFTPGQLLPKEEGWKPQERALPSSSTRVTTNFVLSEEVVRKAISYIPSPMRQIRAKLRDDGYTFKKYDLNRILNDLVKKQRVVRIEKDAHPWYSIAGSSTEDTLPKEEKRALVLEQDLKMLVEKKDQKAKERMSQTRLQCLQGLSMGEVYMIEKKDRQWIVKNSKDDVVGSSISGKLDLIWGHTYVFENYVDIDQGWRAIIVHARDLSNGTHTATYSDDEVLVFSLGGMSGQIRMVVEEWHTQNNRPRPVMREIETKAAPVKAQRLTERGVFACHLSDGRKKDTVGYGSSKKAAMTEAYYLWAFTEGIPFKRAQLEKFD